MRTRVAFRIACLAALLGPAGVEAVCAIATPGNVFVPVAPCRIADTRIAGGAITGGTNRVFKVLGPATDFTAQGGSASGCGVPDFNGSVAQVRAVTVNIAAANATGTGYLTAFAGDTTRPATSTFNYGTALTSIANEIILPVRQTAPAGTDIKVFASTTTQVFLDVTGYFTDITLVDGSGSGIDADTLDGLDSSAFMSASTDNWVNTTGDTMTGDLTLNTDLNLGGSVKKGGTLFLHDTGTQNLGVGLMALSSNATGYGDTASGHHALLSNTTGFRNTATGAFALRDNTIGNANIASGTYALSSNTSGSNNTATGNYALLSNTTASGNTADGFRSLYSNTTGHENTASGHRALDANSLGYDNTASGSYALFSNTTGHNNTAIGFQAGRNLTTGNYDIDIGNEGVAAESATIRLGTSGLQTKTFIAGINGATVGASPAAVCIDSNGQLGTSPSCGGGAGTVTSVGSGTGLTGGPITTTGSLSLDLSASNTWTGNTNFTQDIDVTGAVRQGGVLLLHGAQSPKTTGVGLQALRSNSSGVHNTATGYYALRDNDTGSYNTANGSGALVLNTNGHRNSALGYSALNSNTIGYRNTASGMEALDGNVSGNDNTATGVDALVSNVSGSNNTATGTFSLGGNLLGNANTAVGSGALAVSTGSGNIALGANAGWVLTTGDANIDIGNDGVAGEGGTIRIGTSGTQTATFIAGIAGVAVSNAAGVLMDVVTGQLGTISSSRRYKEEIRDMGPVSDLLLKLRPVTFRYKKEVQKGARRVEFGLIAEEVAEVFPELVVYNKDGKPETVKYHVLAPLLLNELQKQKIRVEEREREVNAKLAAQREEFNAGLAAQRDQFAGRIAALLERLAAVEARGGPEGPRAVRAAASPR